MRGQAGHLTCTQVFGTASSIERRLLEFINLKWNMYIIILPINKQENTGQLNSNQMETTGAPWCTGPLLPKMFTQDSKWKYQPCQQHRNTVKWWAGDMTSYTPDISGMLKKSMQTTSNGKETRKRTFNTIDQQCILCLSLIYLKHIHFIYLLLSQYLLDYI